MRSSIELARRLSTTIPMSSPYLILRLTYFIITGLSESRKIRRRGFGAIEVIWRAWRSLMKPASSLPLRLFIENLHGFLFEPKAKFVVDFAGDFGASGGEVVVAGSGFVDED